MKVAVVMNYPSHYQVALLNALAQRPEVVFRAFYLRKSAPGRHWNTIAPIRHDHEFVTEWRITARFYLNPGLLKRVKLYAPDLLVVTQYAAISMQVLMYVWSLLRRPWIFWAEAPHVRWSEAPALRNEALRTVGRAVALGPVRWWPKAVWGIGRRARDEYMVLTKAPCSNLPYCLSDNAFFSIRRLPRPATEPLRFLFSGSLIPRKGFDTLIRAVTLLSRRRWNFVVVVAGAGEAADLVKQLPAEARQFFDFVGFKQMAEMPGIYAAADVLVFPSRYDGWGLAIAEAMAAGMPVVATREAGCANDVIEHGVNGYLFDAEDAGECADLMEYLLVTRDRVATIGCHARASAAAFQAAEIAKCFSTLLRQVPLSNSSTSNNIPTL